MKANTLHSSYRLLTLAVVLVVVSPLWSSPAQAQDIPPQRQIRGYIPPDQLVSFRPETPFTQFLDFLNPIFERVVGKQVIDPDSRQQPIGLSISGMHFQDALELVLNFNGLTYRETERFFIVEVAPEEDFPTVTQAGGELAETALIPATLDTREIEINAVLFSINKTKAKDVGIDWNIFFGGETASGGGGGGGAGGGAGGAGAGGGGAGGDGGGGGQQQGAIPRFFVKTDDLANAVDNYLIMPDQFEVSTLTRLFRFLETEGIGETIANPSVTVQSGQDGRIQIGTDFPFVTRDFSGNTITSFISTGIIINVKPTLITEALVDTVGAATLDFIHLNVQVENSNGQITQAGPIVDRSTANTQVLLLDGEQTVIGGLYSTDEVVNRRGIPILKDLPWWVLGLRYLTGVTQKTKIQRELVILLQARLVDPLRDRSDRPYDKNLLERWRRKVEENMNGLSEECDPEFNEYCKSTGTQK